MNSTVPNNKLVSPYLLFFLMHSVQTGVGILGYQSDLMKGAGHNAWLSVLGFGLSLHIVFFMILYILNHSRAGDIVSFHQEVFGKFIGGFLNIIMASYFSICSLFTLHTYIDILQIWVFDGIAGWEFSILFTVLIYYIVSGGFRIVTGIAFWGVVIPSFLLISIFYILGYAETSYLLPLFQFSAKDLLISGKEAAPLYFGFETVLVFFPFIKDRATSHKWGHLALLSTTLVYTIITLITFLFYTQGKLERLTWPTLTLIKIIRLPFLERFEFLFIFTWLLVVMPVICIYLWSAVRAIKLTIPKIKPTYILIVILGVFFMVNSQLIEIKYSYQMNNIISISGLSFLFCYIPLLFLISVIKTKLKRNKTS